MSTENRNNASGGISFAGLLTILFIGLKLTGYIAWSWWWVLAPLWISVAIVVVMIIVGLAFLAVAASRVKSSSSRKLH